MRLPLKLVLGFACLCLVAFWPASPRPTYPIVQPSGTPPVSWTQLQTAMDAQSRWYAAAAAPPVTVSLPKAKPVTRPPRQTQATGSVWDALADCESSGDWAANTGNGFEGGVQFTHSTWLAYGGGEFADHAYNASREEQIVVAERVLAGQGWGAWPTCSRKLGLR